MVIAAATWIGSRSYFNAVQEFPYFIYGLLAFAAILIAGG
jgi:hypothetical protein